MGADALAVIRPAIRELADALDGPDADARGEATLTLEYAPRAEQCWIQVQAGILNIGYPHAEPPEAFLKRCGAPLEGLTVTEWKPNVFATFEFDTDLATLAHVVDAIFHRVQGVEDGSYEPDVRFDWL